MFKFNFNNEEEESSSELGGEETLFSYESKEMVIPPNISDTVSKISRDKIIKLDYECGITFLCLSPNESMNMLKEKIDNEDFIGALEADKEHSDLLPGKYEGGLKTWECTRDLVVYFKKHHIDNIDFGLKEKSVLDLGCGSGILGILCLLSGASVTFQDYNLEVLEAMTIPNIYLNCDIAHTKNIKLYSGDWSSFLEKLTAVKDGPNGDSKKFDYILTSETIYNRKNYHKIIKVLKKLLKPEGLAFVAAKTHYFGVGGSLHEFQSLLKNEGLLCELCWETKEGVSRGILEVKHV